MPAAPVPERGLLLASFSINSNLFRLPGATLRFKRISRLNDARSMSHDTISGSRKADAAFRRYIENVCIQKFENRNAHLFITPVALSRYDAEPIFAPQFLSGQHLDDIQKLLSDQPFKLAKRFLLENGTDLRRFDGFTFLKKQFSDFFEQRQRRDSGSSF